MYHGDGSEKRVGQAKLTLEGQAAAICAISSASLPPDQPFHRDPRSPVGPFIMGEELRPMRRTERRQRARLAGEADAPCLAGAVGHLDRGLAPAAIARAPHRPGRARAQGLAEVEARDRGSRPGLGRALRSRRGAVQRTGRADRKPTGAVGQRGTCP